MSIYESINKYFKGRVTFDDGSYIEHLDRDSLIFVENDHEIIIGFDDQGSLFNSGRIILASDIKEWSKPTGEKSLSEEKKEEIVNKMIAYCDHHKIKYEIQ